MGHVCFVCGVLLVSINALHCVHSYFSVMILKHSVEALAYTLSLVAMYYMYTKFGCYVLYIH